MRTQEGTPHDVHKKHKYELELFQQGGGVACDGRRGVFTLLFSPY